MRSSWALVLAVCLALFLMPVSSKAGTVVPALQTSPLQDHTSRPLSAVENKHLEDVIRANTGSEQYKILLIDSAKPEDLTAYLDTVWAHWKLPANTVLFVVATQENNAIRFNLGTDVAQRWGVSVDFMLGAIRAQYAGPARDGRLAEALAVLVAETHKQVMAGGGKAKPPIKITEELDTASGQLRLPSFDLMNPLLPWLLFLSGIAALASAIVSYTRRLRRWNAHMQARLDRGMTYRNMEEVPARHRR